MRLECRALDAAGDGGGGRRGLLALAGAWLLTTAMTRQEPTAAQRKLLEHYTNNDPGWALLATAGIAEDRDRGRLNAVFTPDLQRLADRAFTISGFMSPLETAPRTRHFLLTRRSTTCPFCPPNTPTEAIEVTTDKPVVMTDAEVSVTGRLTLRPSSDAGLFFSLAGAARLAPPRGAPLLAATR